MSPPLAALVAALAIGAGPAKDSNVRLAAPGLTLVDVDRARGTFYLDYFCEQLSHQGPIRITTESEVAALVGFERERELLGCSDATKQACFVELANALGVDGLIVGNVAKVGSGYAATIKVVSSRDGDTFGSRSTRVHSEDELLDWLQQSARELAPPVIHHRHGGADLVPADGPGDAASGPLGKGDAPPMLPVLPAGSGPPNQLRVSIPLLRAEYSRRLWPKVLLGVRAGAPLGATALGDPLNVVPSLGGNLAVLGRFELGARSGLRTELVATAGGGYWYESYADNTSPALTASAGAALAWGNFRLGLEALFVYPLNTTINLHVAALPELAYCFEF